LRGLEEIFFYLGLVWETKNRRGFRILNKERILAPLIPSDIWTLKLALKVINKGNWRGSSIQSCKGEDLIHSNPP
jgi:hypothetical protein